MKFKFLYSSNRTFDKLIYFIFKCQLIYYVITQINFYHKVLIFTELY